MSRIQIKCPLSSVETENLWYYLVNRSFIDYRELTVLADKKWMPELDFTGKKKHKIPTITKIQAESFQRSRNYHEKEKLITS